MENFIISLKVIAPLMIYMLLGVYFKRRGMISDQLNSEINSLIVKVFLPFVMFNNIYAADLSGLNGVFGIYAAIATMTGWAVFFVVFTHIERDPARAGSMAQGAFRSNAIIFGIPVAASLFGEGNTVEAALTMAICIPIYNVLCVVGLEICGQKAKLQRNESSGKGRVDGRNIILSIVRNRLIWGALLGLLVNILHLDLPDVADTCIKGLAGIVTPLAFVALGASFSLNAATKNVKALVLVSVCKLVLYPLVFMVLPICWGWTGRVLGAMMLVSAAPTAISSFPMAESLGCDGELAGEIVAVTSVLSVLTMFLWIFGLKQFGLM